MFSLVVMDCLLLSGGHLSGQRKMRDDVLRGDEFDGRWMNLGGGGEGRGGEGEGGEGGKEC